MVFLFIIKLSWIEERVWQFVILVIILSSFPLNIEQVEKLVFTVFETFFYKRIAKILEEILR